MSDMLVREKRERKEEKEGGREGEEKKKEEKGREGWGENGRGGAVWVCFAGAGAGSACVSLQIRWWYFVSPVCGRARRDEWTGGRMDGRTGFCEYVMIFFPSLTLSLVPKSGVFAGRVCVCSQKDQTRTEPGAVVLRFRTPSSPGLGGKNVVLLFVVLLLLQSAKTL
jgi:hypothetical protein